MIMVVVLHLNLFGGLLSSATTSDNLGFRWVVNFYEEICLIAVNVFVIVSSWFLSSSKSTSIKTKRVLHLIVSMFFWFVVSTTIAYGLGVKIGINELLSYTPIIGKSYGFITGYIVLYLLSPYLNKLTSQLSNRAWLILVVGLFILFSLSAPIVRNGYLYINGGYSFAWFTIIYLIVGFIRNCTHWDKYSWKVYVSIFSILTIIGTVARIYIPSLYVSKGHYNDPIVFCSALSCFLLFASIKIGNKTICKLLSFFVPLSVAVFFIHANPFIEQWFEEMGFESVINEDIIKYMVYIPSLAVLVFVFCTLFDYIKEKLFDIIRLTKIVNNISIVIDKKLEF